MRSARIRAEAIAALPCRAHCRPVLGHPSAMAGTVPSSSKRSAAAQGRGSRLRRFRPSWLTRCPHSGVPTAVVTRRADAASESDQVEAGERMVNLLHGTAAGEVAEVDHSEAGVL